MTDIEKMISQLEQQRGVIDRALSALREVAGTLPSGGSDALVTNTPVAAPKRGMSREARKRIGDASRKRWAAKRAEEAGGSTSAANRSKVQRKQRGSRKGRMSEEGRKRIAEANRKRWAAKRAAGGGQKSPAGPAKKAVSKK